MAAYVLVDIDVTDPEPYEEYKRLAAPTVAAFGGRYIVRGGNVHQLEGQWPTARFVVLEFPSVERARAWWDSELYRPIRAMRYACASSRMILVEGV